VPNPFYRVAKHLLERISREARRELNARIGTLASQFRDREDQYR